MKTKTEEICLSEISGASSESLSCVVKKLEFSCDDTNEWGGMDLMPQILRALEIKDPDFYTRTQVFYSSLNYDELLGKRCSSAILMDLFFGGEFFGLNPFTVVDEIKSLEQLEVSQTKKATQFRGVYLGGLWHKHYMNGDVASLARNVQNALKNYGIPFFEEKIKEAEAAGEERFVTAKDIVKIADDVVTKNLSRRRGEGKMTGEWIIYAQHENQNFYLCLAKHHDADEEIRAKIERTCMHEFPFLNELLRESHAKNDSAANS